MALGFSIVIAAGSLILVLGVVMLVQVLRSPERTWGRRLGHAPAEAIASLAPGRLALVRGVARPGPSGEHASSLTGAPALVYRTSVLRKRNDNFEKLVHREGEQSNFVVTDEGGSVMVATDALRLMLATSYETVETLPLRAWVEQRLGFYTGGLRLLEKRVESEQTVLVMGRVQQAADGALTIGPAPSEVFVTNLPLESVLAETKDMLNAALALLGSGVLIVGIGVALHTFVVL